MTKKIVSLILIAVFLLSCKQKNVITENKEQEPQKNVTVTTTEPITETATIDETDYAKMIEEADTQNLFRFEVNHKYAFINYEGELVIPFVYGYVSNFIRGVAKVKNNDETFYIDKKMERVKIDRSKYDFDSCVSPFSPTVPEDQWPEARPEVKGPYELGRYMGDGWFQVIKPGELPKDNRYGICDIEGNILIEPEYLELGIFINGMAAYEFDHSGPAGYIRNDGKIFSAEDYWVE